MSELLALTGLRGVLALYIFMAHASANFGSNKFLENSRIGVSYFYVLSGFVMSYAYRSCDFSNSNCKKSYWTKRFARVVPVYYLSLILAYKHLSCIWHGNCNGTAIAGIILAPLLLQSWFPCNDYTWNGVAWSLSIEMFFYLVFPYLEKIIKKLSINSLYVSLIIIYLVGALPNFLSAVILDFSVYDYIFCVFNQTPPLRLYEFLMGIIVYHVFSKRQEQLIEDNPLDCLESSENYSLWTKIGIEFIFPSTIIFLMLSAITAIMEFLTIGGFAPIICLQIYLLAADLSFFSWILALKPFVYLGKISFCFYLLHNDVGDLIEYLEISSPWVGFLQLVLVFLLSSLSHFYLEIPVYKYLSKGKSCIKDHQPLIQDLNFDKYLSKDEYCYKSYQPSIDLEEVKSSS
jgi:peptidoglycan/LPS O-acetylase OafA/YrhL